MPETETRVPRTELTTMGFVTTRPIARHSEERAVVTGARNNLFVEVLRGLKEGESVLRAPHEAARSGKDPDGASRPEPCGRCRSVCVWSLTGPQCVTKTRPHGTTARV